jgi:hypothetical protein
VVRDVRHRPQLWVSPPIVGKQPDPPHSALTDSAFCARQAWRPRHRRHRRSRWESLSIIMGYTTQKC